MSCRHCGRDKTIKAHLIPRAFCTEVRVGKNFAAGVSDSDNYAVVQSGTWDKDILCSECDGRLGEFENYVFRLAKEIRAEDYTVSNLIPRLTTEVVKVDQVLRFCAGILYKYAITAPEKGRIDLGLHRTEIEDYALKRHSPRPQGFGVMVFRPIRYPLDHGLFAYRAPQADNKDGFDCFRMMMGGLLFFVFSDNKDINKHPLRFLLWSESDAHPPIFVVPAQAFEEFTLPAQFIQQGKLSTYLDRSEN